MSRLLTIVDADFALDGGAMMGIVPRPLWERVHPPDARHRIPLVSRFAVLADGTAGRLWLVDCGIGRDWDRKATDIYAIRPRGADIHVLLKAAGFDPDAVTDIVLTHLHFDHAGGLVRRERSGRAVLAFPWAMHHVQRAQWQWARGPSLKDAGSFRGDHLALFEGSLRLHLVDGDGALGPRVSVRTTSGHSPGMQVVMLQTDERLHAFCADLIPTWPHVRGPWVMAYDIEPVRTIEEKLRLLKDAAEKGWVLVSEHDRTAARARVRRSSKPGVFEVIPYSTPEDR